MKTTQINEWFFTKHGFEDFADYRLHEDGNWNFGQESEKEKPIWTFKKYHTDTIGGPPGIVAGVAIGGAFYAGEMIYDGVKASAADTSDPDNNANTIHSIGEFFRNFGWALDNLERGLLEGIND